MNRSLTEVEVRLIRWMLDHGEPGAAGFLAQLNQAEVTPWRCPCGCASINFSIQGQPNPSGGMNVIADFVFGTDKELSGIFIYEVNGILAGLEVSGYSGDAPKSLPSPEELRPFSSEKR
jgi:hypothetical protein